MPETPANHLGYAAYEGPGVVAPLWYEYRTTAT